MTRFALSVEYDGTRYSGWQSQPGGTTIQSELQSALGSVANHPVSVVCAGRTDAGVHACAQIAHFDSDATRSVRSWQMGTNTALPKDISVNWVRAVDDTFHARFSAVRRSYRYVILNRSHRSALLRNRVHFEPRPLHPKQMQEASGCLLGQHDFSAFRAAACQARSPVRTVSALQVSTVGDYVIIDISADAFLQNMVRIVAGVLMRVGRGEAPVEWVRDVLEGRDRRHPGVTAPASGLYLTAVHYPGQYGIPILPVAIPPNVGFLDVI